MVVTPIVPEFVQIKQVDRRPVETQATFLYNPTSFQLWEPWLGHTDYCNAVGDARSLVLLL